MMYKLIAIDSRGLKSETIANIELEEKEIEDNVVIICPSGDNTLTSDDADKLINRLGQIVAGTKKTYFVSGHHLEAFKIERIDVPPNGKKHKRSRIEALEFNYEK